LRVYLGALKRLERSFFPYDFASMQNDRIAGLIVRSRSLAAIDAFIRFATIEAAALVDANIGIVLSPACELFTHRTLDAAGIAEFIANACRGSSAE
jgi:hypothetical protein